MNDQYLLVGSAACAALGSMVWEFGRQRKVSVPAAIVGVFSIIGLSYLAINPVGDFKSPGATIVGIQNISLSEDPIMQSTRKGALIVAAKYKQGYLPGYSRKLANGLRTRTDGR